MIKEFLAGISVGIANAIPGVSGGTMLVIWGVFEKLTTSVSDLVSKNKEARKARKDACIFLGKVLLGVAIGIVFFAKLLNAILLKHFPVQTLFWFMGMVAASVPVFIRREMKHQRLALLPLLLGMLLIGVITYFAPAKQKIVLDVLPEITASHLFWMVLIGIIGGSAMIIPGVSGSMILLLIGKYSLFTTYVAKVTTLKQDVLISLAFIASGLMIGIVCSSKLCKYLFKVAPRQTNSFILGLIIASAIALFPLNQLTFNIISILSYLFAICLGGIIVYYMDKFA